MARMIFSASTPEEAMERAAQELGLPLRNLEYDILEDTREQEVEEGEEPGVCIRVRVNQEQLSHEAAELLRGLLQAMDLSGEVEARADAIGIHLMILGSKSSVLIGRDGQTLDSIQHWLTRAVARVAFAAPRLFVDVENYRSRKFSKLERLARDAAAQALKTGEPQRLDPMGPVERKFIHNALKNVDGVSTYSIGREGRRRLVISPGEGIVKSKRDDDDYVDDEDNDGGVDHDEDEGFSSKDMLSDASAFSQLRVIATSTNRPANDDEELEDELVSDFDEDDEDKDNLGNRK